MPRRLAAACALGAGTLAALAAALLRPTPAAGLDRDSPKHGGTLEATFRGGYARLGVGKGHLAARPATLWDVRAGDEIGFPGQAVMALDYVFVGARTADTAHRTNGTVRAYDAHTGKELWSRATTGAVWTSPTYDDGRVYAGTDETRAGAGDGELYAFNARSGAELWRFPTKGKIWGAACVRKGTVLAPSSDHHLYAVSADSGREAWAPFDAGSEILLSPACAGDRVYLAVDAKAGGAAPSKVIALDVKKKGFVHRWTYELGGALPVGVAVTETAVVTADFSGAVVALDPKKGTVRWRASAPGPVADALVAAGSAIFACAAKEGCRAFDSADGHTLWTYAGAGGVRGAPVFGDGILYVPRNGATGSEVFALDATRGDLLWTVSVPGTTRSSLGLFDGVLLHGTETGVLYAFGGEAPPEPDAPPAPFSCAPGERLLRDDVPRGALAGFVHGHHWELADGAAVRKRERGEWRGVLFLSDRPYARACDPAVPAGATILGLLLSEPSADTFSRPSEVPLVTVAAPGESYEHTLDAPRAWIEVDEAGYAPGGTVRGRMAVCLEDGGWIGGEFSVPGCAK